MSGSGRERLQISARVAEAEAMWVAAAGLVGACYRWSNRIWQPSPDVLAPVFTRRETQASHRKYQCLGFVGFAGADGLASSLTTVTGLIFTTRFSGMICFPPISPVKW